MLRLTSKYLYCLILLCFSINAASQQISTSTANSIDDLILNALGSDCVEISNITSQINGSEIGLSSYAFFNKENSDFPFDNGIMLSTGSASSGGNAVNTEILNEGDESWETDPDLESALGISGTLNATSIEFDFISIANQIQFNYILASEEYFANFPCDYSDGFAFLIKPTGSSAPYSNIALIPGTTIPVNTNTIHQAIVGFCDSENEQYFEGYNLGDTNYNGRTTVMTASASIEPNVSYHIKLVIADQTDRNYDSAVFIEGSSFSPNVSLGEDIVTCSDTVYLNGDIFNSAASYSWYFNDELIPDQTQADLTLNASGNYRIQIEIPLGDAFCVIEDDINIELNNTAPPEPIEDYQLCDDVSNDGQEIFDLDTMTDEVLASVSGNNYQVSYHFSSWDAQNYINPITNNIENLFNNQTIHVRIEDTVTGCLLFNSFNLVVNPLPFIYAPIVPLDCEAVLNGDEIEVILSDNNEFVTIGEEGLEVTYHSTPEDAGSGTNVLDDNYIVNSPNDQLYIRVVNPETGCISTTYLDFNVVGAPNLEEGPFYIDACDYDYDGFAEFDLTSIIEDVYSGNLDEVTITFHPTAGDASSGENAFSDDTNFANTVGNIQIIHIRVENNETGCFTTEAIELHTNLLLTGTEIRDFTECDIDNDNSQEFNLSLISVVIMADVPNLVIDFYETEEDRTNETNVLDIFEPYVSTENPKTLYLTITSPDCVETAEIDLIMDPVTEFDVPSSIDYCDDDQNGFVNISFDWLQDFMIIEDPNFSINYYYTLESAEFGFNALDSDFDNFSNPLTLYIKIGDNANQCSFIQPFDINIIPAPAYNTPQPFFICEPASVTNFTIDLTTKVSEILDSTDNLTLSYYRTEDNAEQLSNPINTPSNFEVDTNRFFIRIDSNLTGCYSIAEFDIIINSIPEIQPIEEYTYCADVTVSQGQFLFNTKDEEILNGQTGKEVLYFESLPEAVGNINAINKNNNYDNVSNPQTIYVRVQNFTDPNCYTLDSFSIQTGVYPLYNEPTDWFVCDDVSNDGVATFDLNEKSQEISEGINQNSEITYYTTIEDAESGENQLSLNHTNTVNPQQIFVKVDTGNICKYITSFELNVIQLPIVNNATQLVTCDNDYDGFQYFDLTNIEVEILDVRNNDIQVTYYESMLDLENEANAIVDPDVYNNISNPQTIYIKVNNTITNCFLSLPLDLVVNLPPQINEFESIIACEDDIDNFDLTQVDTLISDSDINIAFTYYASFLDAYAEENPLDTNHQINAAAETVFARVEFTTTHCFIVYPFDIIVNPVPIANTADDFVLCDDDYDGFLEIDLHQQNNQILGSQNASLFELTYYASASDAENHSNQLDQFYQASDADQIFARVENLASGCFSISNFSITINPQAIINVTDQVVCLDDLPLTVSAYTFNDQDSYQWSTGAITPTIEITEIGTYFVSVTTENGCEMTKFFNVSESEQAVIEFTETIDFSDPNNITVEVSGIGNYMYQLDNNEPQESNFFGNVSLGYHTITVIDLNGCNEVSKEIVVIDAPKFVTPNNDGHFDTWHITGVETLPGTEVYIFDRYGKQLAYLTYTSGGWDGKYNGYQMPAADYWFLAQVRKGDLNFEVRGHFSLRL